MRTIGYARVSTDDGRQELGLDAQQAKLLEAGAAEVVEDQHSGSVASDKRPGLAELLKVVRKGDTVLVTKLDRLSRDVEDLFRVIRSLTKRKVKVVSIAEGPLAATTGDEVMLLAVRAGMAAAERLKIAERTRDALARKKAKGERVGCVPYGFKLAADGVHLEADSYEASVIELALQLKAEGKTVRAIAGELEQRSLVGRTGRPLSHNQVWRIVRRVG